MAKQSNSSRVGPARRHLANHSLRGALVDSPKQNHLLASLIEIMLIAGGLVGPNGFRLDFGRRQIVYRIVQVLHQRKRPFVCTSLAADRKAIRGFLDIFKRRREL